MRSSSPAAHHTATMNKYLLVPLRFLRLIIDYLSDLIFGFFCSNSHKPIPPVSDVLLLDPAVVLAEKIRTGKVTSEQVVQVYIKRALEVNDTLNCFVDTRYVNTVYFWVSVNELKYDLCYVDLKRH